MILCVFICVLCVFICILYIRIVYLFLTHSLDGVWSPAELLPLAMKR